jgi:choline dehydrogenase
MKLDRRRLILSTAAGAFTIPFSNLLEAQNSQQDAFDYIIVGAGSAGCIIAATLAEQLPDATILLLEAGGAVAQTEAMVWDPSLYLLSLVVGLPELEWGYMSEPQPGLDGRSLGLIRGKGLGGCSIRNGMVYVRGGETGFNSWAAQGAPGWDFATIQPHFEAVEQRLHLTKADSDPLTQSLTAAAMAAGFPYTDDYNAQVNPNGIGPLRYMIRDRRRETVHSEFLEGRHFPNLSVLSGKMVQRIVCKGSRASGVMMGNQGDTPAFVAARKEVILSTGAIGSPHLLMLSGFGNPTELGHYGITPTVSLPGVGQNFQDDLIVSYLFMSPEPLPEQKYGIMGLVGFGRTTLNTGLETDLEFHFGGAFDQDRKFLMISPMILLAESRGFVKLKSANPFDHPLINPGYLNHERDLARLVEGCQLARQIAADRNLDAWRGQELSPGASVLDGDPLKEFIRKNAQTGFHYAGTCRMGNDPFAVVDPTLKVHGMDNLRVADASIIPRTVSGNTAGATMMIAHRAACLIAAAARS